MKIPLIYRPDSETVFLPSVFGAQGRTRRIVFVVDTGSSDTTVSYRDAILLGIEYDILPISEFDAVTYGGRVNPYILGEGEFFLVNEEGEEVMEILDSIDVLPTLNDEDLDRRLSSVIGMDFLRKCSYALYLCPNDLVAYLEKV
ncbi:MAG: hypothetical protein ACXADD_18400 [Candidatus Thorarchaeota archaeon]|jgi:hypothetical protein